VFRTTTLILLFLVCTSSTPGDDKLLVPEDTSPIQLCPDCTTIKVLLKPGKSKIDLKEQPQIAGVFLSGAKKETQIFKVKWIGEKRPEALEITLDLASVARSGTYDLYIDLQPQSNPTAERLHLQMIHPEPKLNTVPKLLIDRTYNFFGWESDTHPRLILVESSNLSNLTKVNINQNMNTVLGAKLVGGTVHVTDPKTQVDAGMPAEFAYEVINDFPLGTATGALTIRAAETSGPVGNIDFEVRSRLHPAYIAVTILIGLVLSYFLKVRLQQQVELDQAKLDARKLFERVVQEEGKHLDPEFRRQYADAKGNLERALQADDAGDINTKKTSLDTAWRDALQKLATRHQEQESNLTKATDTFSVPWFVPKSIREAVEKANHDLASAQTSLDADDLPEVKRQLTRVLGDLGNAIRTNAIGWQVSVSQILDELLKTPLGVSKAIGEKLAKPVDDVRGMLNKISAATELSTTEQLHQALVDLRTERTAAAQFFDWLRLAVSTEVSAVDTAAKPLGASKWNTVAFGGLEAAERDLEGTLSAAPDTPSWEDLAARLGGLHDAWVQALQKQLPTSLLGVDDLLKARDYKAAAEAVLQQLKKNNKMLGPSEALTPLPIQIPGFTLAMATVGTSPAYFLRAHLQTLFRTDPVTATSVTEANKLKLDKLWQSVIVGLIITVFGYGTQLGTFVGTFTELSTLFFWAFGLDLTVDTLRTVVGKKAS
jgi:hypothetical protein